MVCLEKKARFSMGNTCLFLVEGRHHALNKRVFGEGGLWSWYLLFWLSRSPS